MPWPHDANPPDHEKQAQHRHGGHAYPRDDLRLQEFVLLGVLEVLAGDLLAVRVRAWGRLVWGSDLFAECEDTFEEAGGVGGGGYSHC